MQKHQFFQQPTIILLVLAAVLLLPWLGGKEFYSRGESREALVAQRMMLTGDYVLPETYDGVVPSKPPMLHWFINVVSSFSGYVTEYTSRLPSALASIFFLVGFQIFLSRRKFDPLLAPLILLTSFEWFRASTTTRVDGLLSVFIAGSLLLLYRWYESGFKGIPFWSILLLGCAALTKGPIGLVLPLTIFGSFLLFQQVSVKRAFTYCTLLAIPAGIIALLWYAVAYFTDGDRFLDKVYYENVARFTSTMDDEPHKHNIFYLYSTLLAGFMPWTLLVVPGIIACSRSIRRIELIKNIRSNPFYLFSTIASLIIIIFFSIPSSKRSTYLLPAYPFLAFLISEFLISLARRSPELIKKISMIWGVVVVLLCCALGVLFFSNHKVSSDELNSFIDALRGAASSRMFTYGVIVIGSAALSFWCLRALRKNIGSKLLFTTAILFFIPLLIVQSLILNPTANTISYRSFADETRIIVQNESKLYSYEDAFYGISFYLKKQFYSLQSGVDAPEGAFIYLFERNLEKFKASLAPGRDIQVLARSTESVVKIGQHVLLVKVSQHV